MNVPGRSALLATKIGYALHQQLRWGLAKRPPPAVRPMNKALTTQAEVDASVAELARLRLPTSIDAAKNWDSLGALNEILERIPRTGLILDAGAEVYSRILPWLYLYGYRNLIGNNLAFKEPFQLGSIRYEHGDITATRFADAHFDAITCLSVIEHGVDLELYFKEMARILKRGGLLVTSTDYFAQPTDTQGKTAFGCPIRVFTAEGMRTAFATAEKYGLKLTQAVDLATRDRVVHWKRHDLRYTFIVFAMTRV
jgi:SAM-dependent methyltransferase